MLFRSMGLPDLTTRRGLEEFYHDIQIDLEHSYSTLESIYDLPGRSFPAVGLPVYNKSGSKQATLPYTEEQFETEVGEIRQHKGTTQEGRLPRESEIVYKPRYHAFSDTKLRAALRLLRQKIELGKDVTKEDLAAKTYLDNKTRSSFGDVLRDLAFDLAMFKLNPDEHGANSLYRGEGGRYAERFRAWLENNVDKNTIELLDQLIADNNATYEANKKFDSLVSDFKRSEEKFAEKQREA